ncbi:MAG: fimbria/pilus periplasmic chaperone [Alphaproteobacteria bacterium]|nr:fimbria/pilus periplasmic chaperone [Alphaproteobacteria bacterium]
MLKKLFLYLVVCLTAAAATSNLAFAQNAILYVSPNRVTLTPDENISVLNVSNQSEEERRYDLTMVEQVMTTEGLTQRLEQFEYSARRMLRFVPKRFTLKPGERQTVRVMAKRPATLEDGDYHSHLLFREIPVENKSKADLEEERNKSGRAQFDIRAIYGVAVPIIVQKGNITSEMVLSDVNYIPASDGAPAHLAVTMNRTGNAEASSRLKIIYQPASGDEVTLVNNLWIPIYREVDTVTKRFPLTEISGGLRGGKVILTLSKETGNRLPDGSPELITQTKEVSF